MWPPVDSNYRMCATNGEEVLETILSPSTCPESTYAAYLQQIEEVYGAEKKESSIHGE